MILLVMVIIYIYIPGSGYNGCITIPVNEDAMILMDKKIDELMFMIKRDIVIMMRFGITFEFQHGRSFNSLFGHIP